jgi:hypothetical protein
VRVVCVYVCVQDAMQIGSAYSMAVGTSVGIAMSLKYALSRLDMSKMSAFKARTLPMIVPYMAVAGAGAFNVAAMRWNETQDGVTIRDRCVYVCMCVYTCIYAHTHAHSPPLSTHYPILPLHTHTHKAWVMHTA